MAENVTGQIGGDQVSLENAATEATLKLLLQATLATTKEQKKAVADLVQKAGLDPEKVKEANIGLTGMALASAKVGGAFAGLNSASDTLTTLFLKTAAITEKLTSGTGQASDIFGTIAGMGGAIGLVGTGFQKLAKFQEEQLANYQSLVKSGISFGGSLTDMRLAASNMYLSMEDFVGLMKSNSENFAKMGGTADEGATAFKKLGAEMAQSEVGQNLRDLGISSKDSAEGLANYLSLSGARNKQEMMNSTALIKSAGEYMTQLDALAEITGKTKEEQEKALKEANANAAYESYLQGLDEEGRKKATLAMQNALAAGGKAGADLLKSELMGLPPMTEAAQKLQALGPEVAKGISNMGSAVGDTKKTIGDVNKGFDQARAGANVVAERFKGVAGALSFGSDSTSTALMGLQAQANRNKAQGIVDAADSEKQRNTIAAQQKERQASEAAAAAETQKAVQAMGNELLNNLMPIVKALLPVVNAVVGGLASVVEWLSKSPIALGALVTAVGLATAAFVAMKVKAGIGAVAGMVGGGGSKVAESVGGGAGGGGLKALGSGIKGIGMSLASLGPQAPMIAAGAAAVGAAIVLIGAGIAGAAWLMGKALPTLAEGIGSFAAIDGKALVDVGLGITALGAGLAVFGAGGVMSSVGTVVSGLVDGLGGLIGVKSPVEKLKEFATLGPGLEQAGNGIQAFTTNMNLLLSTDLSKISKLTAELQKLKEASTPADKGILATASDLVKSAITSTASPTEGGGSKGGPGAGDMSEILTRELKALNKQTETLVKAMREAADSTAKTASLIASNGNLFRA